MGTSSFLTTIYQVFLPISFPVIGGALLCRFRKLDTKPLSVLSLFVLNPALIFQTLLKAQMSYRDIAITLLFSALNLVILWFVAFLFGKIQSLSASEKAGLTMVSTFTNCVNYGLPVILLAFGKAGMDMAAIYVVVQMIIVNTFGVYFAARSQFNVKQAVKNVFTMPAVYAAVLAILFRLVGIMLPDSVEKGVSMLSQSYSPVVLAILGAQLVGATQKQAVVTSTKALWSGLFIRIIAAPCIAYILLLCLGVEGIFFSVLLVLASMPAAVNAVILAEQFNASPQFVSKCILWTTIASFFVLPLLLKFFQ